MIEILVKIIIVAVAVIVFAVSFREEWRRLRNWNTYNPSHTSPFKHYGVRHNDSIPFWN